MSTRHTYETTYEQTRDDGTITASIDVRITYDYFPATPGYFSHITGDAEPPSGHEIEWVEVEERGEHGWQKAQPAVRDWAIAMCDEDPANLIEHATDAWEDA